MKRLLAGGGWRRLLAAALPIALAAIAFIAYGGGEQPPATGAARLVPADALLYVHVSTDSARAGTRRATTALGRFALVRALTQRLVGTLNSTGQGVGVDYERDIAPWIGGEVALALLNTGGTLARSEIVIAVRHEAGAREFLARLGDPGVASRYRGVTITAYGAQALAFVRGYLVLGRPDVLHEAIDRAQGRGAALAGDRTYRRAAAGAPAGRYADAYASADGVRRVLAPQGGALGALGALLAQPALQGVALSLTAAADRIRVRIHAALGPRAAGAGAPAPPFAPTLADVVRAPVILYLDVAGLDRTIPRLVSATRAASVTSGFGPLLFAVGTELTRNGVDLPRQLAPLFAGESALALLPGKGGARPTLLLLARVRDERAARTAMARLQAPIAKVMQRFGGSSTVVPAFNERTVAGVVAYQVQAGGFELDYAVHGGRLVISTALDGLAAAMGGPSALASRPAFRDATRDGPARVSSVLFLDLQELLALGERTGLARDPTYLAIQADLRRVRAAGLVSSRGESDSTTELSLLIS